MRRHKLLLISCYFPPAGGIQVQRALSLARYLPAQGFEVHVLTSRASVPTIDPDLINEIPPEVHVHRTWTLEPPFQLRKRIWCKMNAPGQLPGTLGFIEEAKAVISGQVPKILCPDPQVLWYPFALRKAQSLVGKAGIQTVLVTAPPFSAFLIANALKRRYPHLCVIADMRDEWLRYFVKEFGFRNNTYVVGRAAEIERATVKSCERVVMVTPASLREISDRYPQEPRDKFALIPNGYDPASFADFKSRPHNSGNIVITYTGTIYKPCSPKDYLDALERLPGKIRSTFESRFVGRIAEEFDSSIFVNRAVDIRLFGYVPHKTAVRFMEETDVLLLLCYDRLSVPGKLFEYLITGKSILALAYPDSDVARIIHETSSGWCVSPEDAIGLRDVLLEIETSGGRFPLARNWPAIKHYERPRLAAEYARVIKSCGNIRTV